MPLNSPLGGREGEGCKQTSQHYFLLNALTPVHVPLEGWERRDLRPRGGSWPARAAREDSAGPETELESHPVRHCLPGTLTTSRGRVHEDCITGTTV